MRYKLIRIIRKILAAIFYLLPIKKNKIVLINFNGKGYGCNPKYIAQEILAKKLPYDLVWLVNDMNNSFPEGIRKVRYGRVRALMEVATAKIIVTNVKNDLFLIKKRGQYIIQTWHGSYSSKLLENEAGDKLSPQYLKESRKNSAQTDLFISNSMVLTQCYREAFWCECEILECGFPRNDMLFTTNREQVTEHVKKELGLPQTAKLILYAPTFRDDGSTDAYRVDVQGCLQAVKSTGYDWYFIVRMHPNVGCVDGLFVFSDHVIDATTYPDMQELLLASDILITDYSSTVFDFAVMKKPSYIFAMDVEEYQNVRGLKEDFFRMPYPVCKSNSELIAEMSHYSHETGKEAAIEFLNLFGGVDQGNAAEQIVSRIRKVIENKDF